VLVQLLNQAVWIRGKYLNSNGQEDAKKLSNSDQTGSSNFPINFSDFKTIYTIIRLNRMATNNVVAL